MGISKKVYTYYSLINSYLLVILWTYAAVSKLFDFQRYKWVMQHQLFSRELSLLLVWLIPASELLAVLLLMIRPFKIYGLILSEILLLAFTGYVGGITMHLFERVPCACGGIISNASWQFHFLLNISFLTLTSISLLIHFKERRKKGIK
jgi:hypothetical protein